MCPSVRVYSNLTELFHVFSVNSYSRIATSLDKGGSFPFGEREFPTGCENRSHEKQKENREKNMKK